MMNNFRTLNDVIISGSLWGAIHDVNPFPFIIDETPELMDLIMVHLYGERTLYNAVLNKTLPEIAKMIVALHRPKWDQLVSISLENWNVGGGATRKMTELITETENRTNTTDDINKVATFDSSILSNTDGKTSTGNDDLNNTKTRTITDGQYSIATAYTDLQTMDKTAIINTVIKDVAIFTTLSIY